MNSHSFNPAYIDRRPDVERLIPPGTRNILDIGCSNGAAGFSIKHQTGSRIVGIELVPAMAAAAKSRLDEVHVGDAQLILESDKLGSEKFDVIVFADVLEHVVDPWHVLKLATKRLNPDGVIVSSIPNIRHLDTIFNLVFRGYWPYRDRGIHDRTHLRFFTKRNIAELMEAADLVVDSQVTNYRIIERPHPWNRHAHRVAWIPGLKPFLAFQYITRARLRHARTK